MTDVPFNLAGHADEMKLVALVGNLKMSVESS